MIRLLLALHPKARRRTHGEEFAVLLEKSRLTPRAALDVLAQAAKLHATVHRTRLLVGVAVLVSVGIEIIARASGLSANILWPPTAPARTAALLALFAPWAALAIRAGRSRSQRPAARS